MNDLSEYTEENLALCAKKMRLYLHQYQTKRLGIWLYYSQKFRNEAVNFCFERRKDRNKTLFEYYQNNSSVTKEKVKTDKIEILSVDQKKSDIAECSKWLTKRLQQARKEIKLLWGIKPHELIQKWNLLSKGEQAEIPDAYLCLLPRTIFDQIILDIEKTYNKAIKDRKSQKKNPAGFPGFKKHSYCSSVRIQIVASKNKEFNTHWQAGILFIPGLGKVKFRDKSSLPQNPALMFTLSRNSAGHFFVSFLDKDKKEKKICVLPLQDVRTEIKTEKTDNQNQDKVFTHFPRCEGLDMGLTTLGVVSSGKEIKRNRYYKKYERKQKFYQKELSRKQHGSNRWIKQKNKLGLIHTKITNKKTDDLRKQAKEIVKNTAIICLEDLALKNMMKTNLAKSLQDASLYQFKTLLKQCAEKLGHWVIECSRFDPSSKTCSTCGYIHKELTLSERSWICSQCLATHDRDQNAAKNIRLMALRKASRELNTTTPGKGVGTLPPHLHKDLVKFIKRGGLTAMLEYYSRTSQTDEALILPLALQENIF